MSSFFNQVGQLSSNLGHSLGSSVGHALQQGLQAAPEELRIGSHSIIVKEKIAEGLTSTISKSIYPDNNQFFCL